MNFTNNIIQNLKLKLLLSPNSNFPPKSKSLKNITNKIFTINLILNFTTNLIFVY